MLFRAFCNFVLTEPMQCPNEFISESLITWELFFESFYYNEKDLLPKEKIIGVDVTIILVLTMIL